MRRRLVLLSLATTALVVIAFTVPLALLVRQQAEDRARLEAERQAQSLASLVALSAALSDEVDPSTIASAVEPLDEGQMVALPGGARLGSPATGQGALVAQSSNQQTTVAGDVDGGWELAVPVIVDEGTIVVSVFVSDYELSEGVVSAWVLLGVLGLVIIGAAVFVADRLGRTLVEPVDQLVEASHRLGSGDLAARVQISDPKEIEELGRTFNWLAGRLEVLLGEEREAVADLSHGLRTPLTSLRLQADRLADTEERSSLLSQIDRLEDEVDRLIERTRGDRQDLPGSCDAAEVIAARAAFWGVLADDQGRDFGVEIDSQPIELSLTTDTVEAMVDALIGNVFNHTPPGTEFDIAVRNGVDGPVLEVRDRGPGWPDADIVRRGVSGAGSTGLGLDIVRRTAEMNGGTLRLDNRPGGGAVVVVELEGLD